MTVFDECHHTRKNHPYNGIMREYMLLSTEDRPKVFGLTASPIQNAKNPIVSLNELQTNMDARVVGVLDHVDELAEHTPKPVEVIQEYPTCLEFPGYPEPSLWTCLCAFDMRSICGEYWADIERRYYVTLGNLGPFCASLYLFMEVKYAILATNQLDANPRNTDDVHMIVSRPTANEDEHVLSEDALSVIDILFEYETFFELSPTSTVPREWCTPKIKTLVDVLLAHYRPTFQGIVFVEQRQVATCLARVLPYISELEGKVKCGDFLGTGGGGDSEESLRGTLKYGSDGKDVLKLFREGEINLLIATSVAEEGLDFPACDIVIRFDPLQHMVAYVQSRGRARNKISKFIVMLPEGDIFSREKYEAFTYAETRLKDIYNAYRPQSTVPMDVVDENDDEDDETHPDDLDERERFVVPSTSAFASYDNAISLLNHLCSLIPRDLYTPPHLPVFTGDFQATLDLPAALPLAPDDLTYEGPLKHSKKEAKRAVAFVAVKRLYELDVFDEYLLPVTGKDVGEEIGGVGVDYDKVPTVIEVGVRNPWGMDEGKRRWLHLVYWDGVPVAGLITGTYLPSVKFQWGETEVEMAKGRLISLDEDEEETMKDYTRLGVWHIITTLPLASAPSFFLVPITEELEPDYEAMQRLTSHPRGIQDWSGITDSVLVVNYNQRGRTMWLHRVRHDLTPMSAPDASLNTELGTYHEYYFDRWTRKSPNRPVWTPYVPTEGPMIEVSTVSRSSSGVYPLYGDSKPSGKKKSSEIKIMPQGCCSWLDISESMFHVWRVLPVLCKRVVDIYRAREARFSLGIPPVDEKLLIQALTIPGATAGFNNQRLETLGDAVLELCTTVHLFNKYPHKHEGQLDIIRRGSIANRFLCSRALEVGLERFITSETHKKTRGWRYVEEDGKRTYPRRSLQDCVEALVGCAFETGGIPMALHAGVALGLAFGGLVPWETRYARVERVPVPPMFADLEAKLGYTFRNGALLREAMTHPSFSSYAASSSYQRLEFLGDAILDLVVIHYLYRKFPAATSHQLALPRTKAVCSPALASLAVRHLQVHNIIFINNVQLSTDIAQYVPHLEAASALTIVRDGWRYDPPKAISDVFEAIMGAVLIDSGYNYSVTAGVVEKVMKDVLEVLSPDVCLDPVTVLTKWVAGNKCRVNVEFRPQTKEPESEGMLAYLHGILLAGPIVSRSMSVAKNLAAEKALEALKELGGEKSLGRICSCAVEKIMAVSEAIELQMEITEDSDVGGVSVVSVSVP
ncbi:Dicer-like protein 1 [Paramarasmius palmivorus]|uniref:Dicer-like protein 1 n=1 Tax=Paramarasmius palmivorus TaxID=297713 RepID=A0AAW0DEE3_9AGAR